MQAITLYPVITEKFFKAHKRLEEGKCKMQSLSTKEKEHHFRLRK
jgi:hypothetical protein